MASIRSASRSPGPRSASSDHRRLTGNDAPAEHALGGAVCVSSEGPADVRARIGHVGAERPGPDRAVQVARQVRTALAEAVEDHLDGAGYVLARALRGGRRLPVALAELPPRGPPRRQRAPRGRRARRRATRSRPRFPRRPPRARDIRVRRCAAGRRGSARPWSRGDDIPTRGGGSSSTRPRAGRATRRREARPRARARVRVAAPCRDRDRAWPRRPRCDSRRRAPRGWLRRAPSSSPRRCRVPRRSSRFVRPFAIRSSTSSWRGVRAAARSRRLSVASDEAGDAAVEVARTSGGRYTPPDRTSRSAASRTGALDDLGMNPAAPRSMAARTSACRSEADTITTGSVGKRSRNTPSAASPSMPGIPRSSRTRSRSGSASAMRSVSSALDASSSSVDSSSSRSTRRRPARNSAWSSQIRIFIRTPDDGRAHSRLSSASISACTSAGSMKSGSRTTRSMVPLNGAGGR